MPSSLRDAWRALRSAPGTTLLAFVILTFAIAAGALTFLLVALGAAMGLIAAWAGSRGFESVLFDVRPTDPLTFLIVGVVLLAAGLEAAWFPARRASRVDPLMAFRAE